MENLNIEKAKFLYKIEQEFVYFNYFITDSKREVLPEFQKTACKTLVFTRRNMSKTQMKL